MPKKLFDALDDAISAAPTPPSPLLKLAVVAAVAGGDGAGNNTIVEVLALTGTASLRLTDADVAVLVEALTQAHGDNVFLRTLSLRNHRITDDGFALICQKLVQGPPGGVGATLRALDLEGNDIEGKNVGDLRLESQDCHLEALNLRYLSTARHHKFFLFVAYLFFIFSPTRSHNPLILGAGMAIANAVRANRSLHTLSLRACGFPLNTVIAIATTLRQNATLRSLQLDRPLLRYRTSPSLSPSFCAFA
jgi:hypothetical protein